MENEQRKDFYLLTNTGMLHKGRRGKDGVMHTDDACHLETSVVRSWPADDEEMRKLADESSHCKRCFPDEKPAKKREA